MGLIFVTCIDMHSYIFTVSSVLRYSFALNDCS